MDTQIVTPIPAVRPRRSARVLALSALGPLTVVAGLLWAVVQPYRVTLLHPRGQGFWWLLIEPPLLVMAAGAVFAFVVVRPLVADLERFEQEREGRRAAAR